jgi:hypothetical protein
MTRSTGENRKRALALLFGLLCAAGIWFARDALRTRAPGSELVDNQLGHVAQRTSSQLLPRGLTPPLDAANLGDPLTRRVLTIDEVNRWVWMPGWSVYDAQRMYRSSAHVDQSYEWAEYPGGSWKRVTNGEGAREDHEFPAEPPDVFVLVTGDSHTEGFCDNAASYANLLERALSASRPGQTVEVYNTGACGYSFYNYLGVLESLLERKPRIFVTAFFAGNDFFEAVNVQHLYDGSVPPARTRRYADLLKEAVAASAAGMSQGLNELLYLRENPDQADLALRAACLATAEIQRICEEHDIDWIPVYLPSPFDLPLADWATMRARIQEALALSDDDFEIVNRLGDRLLATLRERGTDVLDLRPVFRADSQPLYWSEMHINLRGHEVVARELLPLVEAALVRRSSRQQSR